MCDCVFRVLYISKLFTSSDFNSSPFPSFFLLYFSFFLPLSLSSSLSSFLATVKMLVEQGGANVGAYQWVNLMVYFNGLSGSESLVYT